jgi:hypothetical protein
MVHRLGIAADASLLLPAAAPFLRRSRRRHCSGSSSRSSSSNSRRASLNGASPLARAHSSIAQDQQRPGARRRAASGMSAPRSHTHTRTHARTHTHARTRTHAYARTHAHTQIHTQTHAHTDTRRAASELDRSAGASPATRTVLCPPGPDYVPPTLHLSSLPCRPCLPALVSLSSDHPPLLSLLSSLFSLFCTADFATSPHRCKPTGTRWRTCNSTCNCACRKSI